MNLNTIGLWTSARAIGEDDLPAAARLAESLGYGALWLGGSPRLTDARALLAATERIVIATGIVNVWQYDPDELAAEYAELAPEFPDRLLLGIGIGHPEATQEYEKPLAKMRGFLDGLAAAATPVPKAAMCVAALGPKMLDLAAERTRGTHPYFVPPEHTRYARERLGAGSLVAPELACVVDRDPERARATARRYAKMYLGLQNYTGNLLRFGFTEEDIADGGSDRLIDTIVPQGDAEAIARAAQSHLDAGADHVCLQTVGVSGVPEREWIALSEALIG